MKQRPEHSTAINQPLASTGATTRAIAPPLPPSMTAPPPPPSPTSVAIAFMTAHRHPFNSFNPRPLRHPHQNGIPLPPLHIFGRPTPLAPPRQVSQLRLPRLADRAFSQYTRRRETVFPNPYKEDLYRLNGYCKDVTTYTDRASWDFGSRMPIPVKFQSSWTGAAPKKQDDEGYKRSDEHDEKASEDIDNDADDEASGQSDWETDDEECSGPEGEDESGERSRGRSPTMRRCINGLWGSYAGTRDNYNQRKVRAAAVILRYWRASRGLREWRDFRSRVIVCQRLWRDRITARGNLGGRRIVTEDEFAMELEGQRVIGRIMGQMRYAGAKWKVGMSL